MSKDKPIIYGVLKSDKKGAPQLSRFGVTEMETSIVVEDGIYAHMSAHTEGYLWLRIEQQDKPGVPLRQFRYSLRDNIWEEL